MARLRVFGNAYMQRTGERSSFAGNPRGEFQSDIAVGERAGFITAGFDFHSDGIGELYSFLRRYSKGIFARLASKPLEIGGFKTFIIQPLPNG